MRSVARKTWASIWLTAPPTLIPMGENCDFGMAHMLKAAARPPQSEKANAGEKMLPESAEPMKTLLTATKMAQGPPKAYRVQRVMTLARPNLKKGAGLGMNDSVQCRTTAMATKSARVVIRMFFSISDSIQRCPMRSAGQRSHVSSGIISHHGQV